MAQLAIPFRRFLRHPKGKMGLAVTILAVLVAIFAPYMTPFDPLQHHKGLELQGISARFLFGSDEFGRDIFSRTLYGTRISLLVGLASVAIGIGIGGLMGLIAGYRGGWVETVIMRLCDGMLAFPPMVLGLGTATVLGPGVGNAVLAIGIVNVPTCARLLRASVLAEKEKEYVQAAGAIGSAEDRILLRHILPNVLTPIMVQANIGVVHAILLEAGLSFLGLGAQPPTPSWGTMLNDARAYWHQAPTYGLFPGIALSVLLLGLNFIADAARDALDPRLPRGR